MPLSTKNKAYLAAMGIPIWREQGALAQELSVQPDSTSLDWPALQAAVSACIACELHTTRQQTVFGDGDVNADLMIIGEAPGEDEDRIGLPFAGESGQLLAEMLKAIGFSRQSVFISNVLKCHPTNNREPHKNELAACRGFITRQVELLQPKLIVCIGRVSAQSLLQTKQKLSDLRQNLHSHAESGIDCLVTYHPAYLLRFPQQKAAAWHDLLRAKKLVESKP